jgi:hypothetical protein
MTIVLDTGALLALEWRNRSILARLRAAQRAGVPVVTSAGAVAQAWRGGPRQAVLAHQLAGIAERPIDTTASRHIGQLLGKTATADVVDAHVALLCHDGDRLVTSDPGDLDHLLEARQVTAAIEAI